VTTTPLVIATDGSCLGNPGPGGWAWAISADCWAAGGHPQTTNNLMEMRAVFEAISATPSDQPLVIEADSEYVINIFTQWLEGWKARNWKTAARKPVSNQRAIAEVERVLAGRSVEWRHVRGHAGHALNEVVDLRARAAATAVREGRPVETGPPGCLDRFINQRGAGS